MAGSKASETGSEGKPPIRIKKYANRRLYNTATSSYVTLEDLSRMVQAGSEFVVEDAKTGEDLTRAVLTQIIVEEEQKGQNLLPLSFLRQLIAFYGDNMRWMVPQYLEQTMGWFSRNHDQMRQRMQTTFGAGFPFGSFEDMQKQNLQLFEQAMQMFNPFAAAGRAGENGAAEPDKPADKPASENSIDELRRQLAAMQAQLDALSKDPKR